MPSEADYIRMLERPLTPEKERYLRIRAWWAANDRYRVPLEQVSNEQQPDNLRKLATLLDEKEPNDRLMKAEIYRELGMFDESLSCLDVEFPEEFASAVATIRDLATNQHCRVAQIRDTPP